MAYRSIKIKPNKNWNLWQWYGFTLITLMLVSVIAEILWFIGAVIWIIVLYKLKRIVSNYKRSRWNCFWGAAGNNAGLYFMSVVILITFTLLFGYSNIPSLSPLDQYNPAVRDEWYAFYDNVSWFDWSVLVIINLFTASSFLIWRLKQDVKKAGKNEERNKGVRRKRNKNGKTKRKLSS